MKMYPAGIILAVIMSPLLVLAVWLYRRPQDRLRRIWARHFSLYLFLAYLFLTLPIVFIGPSERLGEFLGSLGWHGVLGCGLDYPHLELCC